MHVRWAVAALGSAVVSMTFATAVRGADVSPSTPGVWTVNTSKVRPGMMDKGRRYLAAAWLPARQEALKRGYVRSFRLLAAP